MIKKEALKSLKYKLFLLVFLLVFNYAEIAWAKPQVSADAAILVDKVTGAVLYQKNAFQPRPPASTTKIMTALLAYEYGNPQEILTVSPRAASVGEASIHLSPHEKFKLESILKGLLIKSGNDAAVAVAEHIGGNEEFFLKMMNAKALLLGAQGTNFLNPNGLPNKFHVSTAFDLAQMARYALDFKTFSETVATKEASIRGLDPSWGRYLKNTNKLLWQYPYADGVKTGTTNAAGQCLVASATKDGHQLIAVVLHSDNRFGDVKEMLDYGFDNYRLEKGVKKGEKIAEIFVRDGHKDLVSVKAAKEINMLLPTNWKSEISRTLLIKETPKAPVKKGQILGYLQLWQDDKVVGEVPLVSVTDVRKKTWYEHIFGWFFRLGTNSSVFFSCSKGICIL